jgi:prepilin-type N-terminal cleavage/methylation domain-containing protein
VNKENLQGFTLIELSIVLVIIGLIVGGVLVGQDLIRAAEVRAQISQIEKYNTAVNTFYGKYQAIPGDMNVATADQFGFTLGAGCTGGTYSRDGNGLIDGWSGGSGAVAPFIGESVLFWQDLTTPGLTSLIDGTYPNSGAAANGCTDPITALTSSQIGQYVPAGKIGHGTYIMASEGSGIYAGINWFILQGINAVNVNGRLSNNMWSAPIPVQEAYKIDAKVDDGLPASGNVQALYLQAGSFQTTAITGASATSSTCYDTTTNNYSLTINGGVGANCAMSFQMQGAAR